ncbi:hypothetical protein ACFQ3N_18655 [Virgibacillus byunsanensis]|uniref:Uncharacterized protein n=1 Tax=Virgibacillus byunsanensis TaxID=570945 RepID=A0ABW3LPQ6_9BACI
MFRIITQNILSFLVASLLFYLIVINADFLYLIITAPGMFLLDLFGINFHELGVIRVILQIIFLIIIFILTYLFMVKFNEWLEKNMFNIYLLQVCSIWILFGIVHYLFWLK